jgi:Ca-activated chloride channel family protein
MAFANGWFLIPGGVLLAILAWWLFRRRPTAALRVSHGAPVRRAAGRGVARLWRLPDALRLVAVALLLVAFARPVEEDAAELVGKGADIVIALDMSGSMNAVDLSLEEIGALQNAGRAVMNRFEIARDIIKQFVANRRGDRVALVVFGREVYLKFPLTLDYPVVLEQLDELVLDNGLHAPDEECGNACTINGAGTALGDALARSWRRLQDSDTATRAIVLITDGKREGGKLAPATVARYIADQPASGRVRVYTFLVGSPTGAKLPRYVRARDPATGGWTAAVARDAEGFVIYAPAERDFPTDPALLKEIADLTGGRYFEAYDEARFREQFEQLEKTEFRTTARTKQRDVFFPWVLAGALVLAGEWLLRLTVFRKFP